MLYLLALVCPPLAVLLVGRPVSAILNVFLSLALYFPGAIHACLVVSEAKANARSKRQTKALAKAMAK